MPPRIPDDKRQAILDEIVAGEKSRNQIARDHDVSPSTVSVIAAENDVHDAFDRTDTENATKAAKADAKARRAELSMKFLTKANQLLGQIDEKHLVFSFGGRDNTYAEKRLDRPPTGDIRNLMIAAATAFDKHMAADRHDADLHGLSAVDQWLRMMLGED